MQGVQDGKQATTRAGREAADLWRQVWHLMDEIGDGVRVSKVKAHTSWWDVWDGKITLRDRGGNEAADAAAKAMLNEALLEAPIRNFSVQAARAMLWAKWIVKYASDWLDDADPMDDVPAVPAERRERGESESNKLEHQVWEVGSLSMCSRCGRQEQLRAGRRGYRADACKGSAGGRALAHATGNKNWVWAHHLHSEADMRKKGAWLIQRGRVPPSMVTDEPLQGAGAGEEGHALAETHPDGSEEGWRPWLDDLAWLYLPHLEQGSARRMEEDLQAKWASGAARTPAGHLLRSSGSTVWCLRCACFARQRHGSGLKSTCEPRRDNSSLIRTKRLQSGLHPLTGEPLK